MSFRRIPGIRAEIYTREDIVNILQALEPDNPRAGFELGWLEALQRVGKAFAIEYEAPERPRMIEGPAR